jgi:hypothetical protein
MDLINNTLPTVANSTTSVFTEKTKTITPADKENFRALITLLTYATSHIDTVYPTLVDAAMPFDKELARKIEAAKKADIELLEYVKSKMERGQALPPIIVKGLLGR